MQVKAVTTRARHIRAVEPEEKYWGCVKFYLPQEPDDDYTKLHHLLLDPEETLGTKYVLTVEWGYPEGEWREDHVEVYAPTIPDLERKLSEVVESFREKIITIYKRNKAEESLLKKEETFNFVLD